MVNYGSIVGYNTADSCSFAKNVFQPELNKVKTRQLFKAFENNIQGSFEEKCEFRFIVCAFIFFFLIMPRSENS